MVVAGCAPRPAPILLFDGTGTSSGDVAAFETILNDKRLDYATASARQLNAMSEAQLKQYRLLIVPGGNFIDMGKSLKPSTTKVHDAVQGGLNYLGVCAGAFLAGDTSYYDTFKLAAGVRFEFYSAEQHGVRKAAVAIAAPGAPALEQYWEDGPELAGWGAVVARYPDDTPAVVEGTSGNGWVILSGVHPEAPERWRAGMTFNTPANVDNDYAATLIEAALNRTSLPHY